MTPEQIQILLDDTKCVACYGMSLADLLKIGLLNNIAAGGGGGGGGILVYRALVSQNGVAAPTAVVLENTLSGAVVWSYVGVGQYRATLAGAFPASKTFFSILATQDSAGPNIAGAVRINDNVILITTADINTLIYNDSILGDFPFEILVYP